MAKKSKTENKIVELQAKVEENLQGWQRAQADYQNLQKEHAKKLQNYQAEVRADLLKEILPMVDKFKTALNFVPVDNQQDAWVVGVKNIANLFDDFLNKNEINQIDTVGHEFDPRLHEAIAIVHDEKFESDQITEEVSAGYKYKDQVLLLAKVVVNK